MDRIFILQYRSGLDTRNPSAPCHTRFPRHAGHGFRPGHHHPGPRRLRHRLHRIPDRRPDPGAGARFRRVGPAGRATGRAVRLHGHAGRPAAHGRAGARGTQAPVRRHPAGLRRRQCAGRAGAEPGAGAGALHSCAGVAGVLGHGQRGRARMAGPLRAGRRVARLPGHLRRPAVRHPIGTLAAAAIGWRASFWGWRRCRCCWPR